MNECWKPIPGYEEHYEISDHGIVKSKDRLQKNKFAEFLVKGKEKKLRRNQSRHLVVDLFKENRYTRHQVNQLVASLFVENPLNLRYVRHLDGNKSNCHFQNLEWGTDDLLSLQRKRYETARKSHLKTTFGITLEDYEELFNRQNGCCAVCHRHQNDIRSTFHVDHSHKDGRIRGLLCNNCNKYVVSHYETGDILRKAADYIDYADTGFVVTSSKKKRKKRRRKSAQST